MVSRRDFGTLVGTLLMGRNPESVRVAAIQMTPKLADVEANLADAERLKRLALQRRARWIVLPEFFTSGIAFHPNMAKAVSELDGSPARFLCKMAREGNAFVGGSFLAWRNGNAYNTFVLALADGTTRTHDKDLPTDWENCYYIGGNDGVSRGPF